MLNILNVDHESKEVDAVAIGPISNAEVENHILTERYFKDLAYREFIDARRAGPLFTPAELREIVSLIRSLSQELKFGPTGVLVSTDVAFGIMRMLEMLVNDVAEVRLFRDEQEARAWLATNRSGHERS